MLEHSGPLGLDFFESRRIRPESSASPPRSLPSSRMDIGVGTDWETVRVEVEESGMMELKKKLKLIRNGKYRLRRRCDSTRELAARDARRESSPATTAEATHSASRRAFRPGSSAQGPAHSRSCNGGILDFFLCWLEETPILTTKVSGSWVLFVW